MIEAAVNRPSSEPRPLVFAVAITLKPSAGVTTCPVFLSKTGLPSRTPCRHMILFVARSISSMSNKQPRSIALMIGPFWKTVSPLMRRKPPIKSSSSVSGEICTRTYSRFALAHACSIIMVLPFPESPETYTGKKSFDLIIFIIVLYSPHLMYVGSTDGT